MNLLRNAAQATRGTIIVRVVRDGNDAVVTVEDDGPGIPLQSREQIFRRFERGDGARATGTGLGLAIASAIVAVAKGAISASDSHLGGARLTVRLPFRV
ncbi:MAG: hypothetical protein GIW95_09855 [Candidatus Eremiobacteraeota bacterium]|nr:hypothetical protein [Candidatus Eremiobacteraeota bacterium]